MQNNLHTKRILTYDDVVKYPASNSREDLVDVRTYDMSIITEYLKEDMLEITGDTIYVRDALAKKLATVNSTLRSEGLFLKIVYGYRHPAVQARYFAKRRNELRLSNPRLDDADLDRLTHNFVAVPDVAGHPSGGAIDLTIVDKNGNPVDMGTEIADYKDPELIQTWDNRLSINEKRNRALLHDVMVAQEFAPFYGEWWHFSYGDREWAAFYNKKALYSAIEIKTIV